MHAPQGEQDGMQVLREAINRPVKRSFTIDGHRTSISLEAPFWEALKAAAAREKIPVSKLIARIDAGRQGCGLSSAVRVWLLEKSRTAAVTREKS